MIVFCGLSGAFLLLMALLALMQAQSALHDLVVVGLTVGALTQWGIAALLSVDERLIAAIQHGTQVSAQQHGVAVYDGE